MPRKPSRPATKPSKRTKPSRQGATRDDAKQQTRAALVRAALELFAERGLDEPSLDAICERAGYTRGAFYVHFKTREDILVAVMEHVGEGLFARVFEGLTAEAASRASTAVRGRARTRHLHHSIARFVETVAAGAYPLMAPTGKGPLVRPHQLLDACARSSVVRERYRGLVQLSVGAVAHLIQQDQAEGDVRNDVDADTGATLGLALVIGAQTMGDLGLHVNHAALAAAFERMLATT